MLKCVSTGPSAFLRKVMNGGWWLLWQMKVGFMLIIWLQSNKAHNGCKKATDHRKKEEQWSPWIRQWSLLSSITTAWYIYSNMSNENHRYHYQCVVLRRSPEAAHEGSHTQKVTRPRWKMEIAQQCATSRHPWCNCVPRKKNVDLVSSLIYSRDLAPNNFFLYLTAKKELKGELFPTRMATVEI